MKTDSNTIRQSTVAALLRSTALLAALSTMLISCGSGDEAKSDPGVSSGAKVIPVDVRILAPQPFVETLQLTGYIKSVEDVIVSTEEGGVLKEWTTPRGAYVRKGDVIARLSDDILRPQYEATRAQYEIAELNYQKQQNVYKEQGISEVQAKTSEFTRDAAKAQADLMKARLDRTAVKSPIDGILDERLTDAGELAPPGSPVARIVNLDRMKVLINVPESFAGSLTRGTPVTISVTALPGETIEGTISFVGAAVIADNRTIPTEIFLRNPGRKLKPDMIARASIRQAVSRKAILVPESTMQQIDQSTYVVYVTEDGVARRRTVTPGGRADGQVEIVSGLKPGDRLIVSGLQNVFDGQKVEITDTLGS